MAKNSNKGIYWGLAALVGLYWFVDNYALTVETTNQQLNDAFNLPIQFPLKNIIFNTSKTPDSLIHIYIDKVHENRIGQG